MFNINSTYTSTGVMIYIISGVWQNNDLWSLWKTWENESYKTDSVAHLSSPWVSEKCRGRGSFTQELKLIQGHRYLPVIISLPIQI